MTDRKEELKRVLAKIDKAIQERITRIEQIKTLSLRVTREGKPMRFNRNNKGTSGFLIAFSDIAVSEKIQKRSAIFLQMRRRRILDELKKLEAESAEAPKTQQAESSTDNTKTETVVETA